MQTKMVIISLAVLIMLQVSSVLSAQMNEQLPYKPTWNSLKNHETPQWLKDGKFGIYTHWGVYAVPAQGPNGTWYASNGSIFRPGISATTAATRNIPGFMAPSILKVLCPIRPSWIHGKERSSKLSTNMIRIFFGSTSD